LSYIGELKGVVQGKEEELQHAIESKTKYRDIYDDSVAQEIQETERQKQKVDDLQKQLEDVENENESAK
jgi:hypothetical protein